MSWSWADFTRGGIEMAFDIASYTPWAHQASGMVRSATGVAQATFGLFEIGVSVYYPIHQEGLKGTYELFDDGYENFCHGSLNILRGGMEIVPYSYAFAIAHDTLFTRCLMGRTLYGASDPRVIYNAIRHEPEKGGWRLIERGEWSGFTSSSDKSC